MILTWYCSATSGFLLALYGPAKYRANSSITNIISFLIIFLAPIYYPIDVLPEGLRYISLAIFTTHSALVLKGIVNLENLNVLSPNLAFLILFSLFLTYFTLNRINWVQKE